MRQILKEAINFDVRPKGTTLTGDVIRFEWRYITDPMPDEFAKTAVLKLAAQEGHPYVTSLGAGGISPSIKTQYLDVLPFRFN